MPERIVRLDHYCTRMMEAMSEELPADLTRDELIDHIRATTLLLKELTKCGKEIFADEIKPLLAEPDKLTDAYEDAFFAVAQRLCSFHIRIDTGMAFSIYQALLRKARHNNDRDSIIKYLYWCGITLFYGNRSNGAEILPYFAEAASYQPQYFEIESADTRQYIHRCLGNHVMILFSTEQYDKAKREFKKLLGFFNQLLFDDIDASFPWLSYFISCMNHFRQYFTKKLHREPENLTRDEIANIFKISLMMSKLAHKNYGDKGVGVARYFMMLWEAQLVAGQISIANFRDNISAVQTQLASADYSNDALHANIMLPCYIIFYVQKLLPDDDAAKQMMQDQLDGITNYMQSLPADINPGAVAEYISLFLKSVADLMPEREHFQWVVKLTTYRHKPTFAHTITVSKLTHRIATEYIKRFPGHFIGIFGAETESQVLEQTSQLLDLAENCSVCHDVGKLIFLKNQTMYARSLDEDEFSIVHEHVSEGLTFFAAEERSEWLTACLHVIEGHHRFYNGQGGYPRNFDIESSPFKAFIYIVSVADALDSGTDDIGKVYADPKLLPVILREIKDGAGTKYSPFVAELLEDEHLLADIAYILDTVRKDAYYAAYQFAEGENTLDKQSAQ